MKGIRLCFLLMMLVALVSTVSIISCSGGSSPSAPTSNTYAATSSVGDFIEWTLDSTAGTFNVTWNVTDSSNTVTKAFTLSGTCGTADATYSYRKCSVTTTSDATSVPTGAVYDVLEVPGVAVFAHPETASGRGNGTGNDEIHIGFTLDTNACANAASTYVGDYVMTHVSPVSNPSETERIGVYRLTSAFVGSMNSGNPSNILHAGFGVAENGGPFRIVYNLGSDTGDNGTFAGSSPFTLSCSGGILKLGGTPSMPGVITSSGLFLFDGPQNFGGIVAAKTSVMATIDDLANKSVVIVWQNPRAGSCSSAGGCTDLLKVTLEPRTQPAWCPQRSPP